MIRVLLAVVLLILPFGTAPGAAQQDDGSRFELEARLWAAAVAGEVRVVEDALGTTVDLESDLGLEDDEAFEGRLTLRPSRRTKVYASWTQLEFTGDDVLTRTIEFGGETFTVSTRIVSTVDLEYGRAGFAWQLLSSDDGRFRVGPLVEVKAFRGEASVAAPDIPLLPAADEEFEAAVGAAGVALDFEPTQRFHLFAEGTVVVGSDEGDATDVELGARFLLAGPLALLGGYRSFSVDAQEEDDALDLDIDGAFVGAQLRF